MNTKAPTQTRTPVLTFWRAVFFAIMLAAAYATYMRFVRGLGASTNLSDRFPWGIWIGFDVLIGVGLAAGGFTVSAVVHVFHMKKYEPMARPAVLTALLGYQLVSVALTFDIGQPWRIWHPLVMWNPHSVMFEVAWCVMLYTTVLAIEFSPVVFERLGWQRPLRLVRALYTPFVIVGVLLSMMHQSSLGTVFLIMPGKLHGLWYTPWLPVFFFMTAVAAGLAMTIVESNLSRRAFGHHLDDRLLQGVARAIAIALGVYALGKLVDLFARGNLGLVFQFSHESVMFWGEMLLGVALPILLFLIPRLRRSRQGLFLGALLTVLGFMLNRLNVSVTGMAGASGAHYVPSWMELAVSAAMVAVGCAGFALAVKYLNVFAHGEAPPERLLGQSVVPAPLVNGSGLATLWSLLAVGAGLLLVAPPSRAQSAEQTSVRAPANTVPAKPSSDLNLPEAFTFPRGGDSPGEVTFTHETHVPRIEGEGALCAACHRSGFSLRERGKARSGTVTMDRMRQGQLCGSCHNGTKAFALDGCSSCHQ
jgi:c(7)-type cytochrome triheme protein